MNKLHKTVLVVAPHPDDETLGCGGSLLKHRQEGDAVHWLIVTGMESNSSYSPEQISKRAKQIEKVALAYGMAGVHHAGFPTTQLDEVPTRKVVEKFSSIFKIVLPNVVYVPNRSDVHSDHKVAFDAAVACTKWFRYPSVKSVYAYETLSETHFNLDPDSRGFIPQLYVDISEQIDKKIEILNIYDGEIKEFPFPRSEKSVRALATLHGSTCGCEAAEAFIILREIR